MGPLDEGSVGSWQRSEGYQDHSLDEYFSNSLTLTMEEDSEASHDHDEQEDSLDRDRR